MNASLKPRPWDTLGVALIGLFVGGAALGQTPVITPKPANLPDTPSADSQGFVKFGCWSFFTQTPINCEVTATLGRIDPAAATPPFFGGHKDHTSLQPIGAIRDASTLGQGPNEVTGQTINGFTILYTAEEASGQVQLLTKWTPPDGFVCQDMNEDNPGEFRRQCNGINHFSVGLKGLNELFATPSDPFVFKPRPPGDLHPGAHFGTLSLQQGITLIGKTYSDLTGGQRPRITDISLPVGGLFDICGTYSATGTCASASKGGHVSHRDGHDVDFSSIDDAGQSIDCVLETTDVMKGAFKKANVAFHQCYVDGHYHVRFR